MPKIITAAIVLLLTGLSCRLTVPRTPPAAAPAPAAATQTEMPALPSLALPAATTAIPPSPTVPPPPQPSSTPQPPELDDLRLFFWDVQVSYDPAVWQPVNGDLPMLEHRRLAGCQITEQGPTEPPMNTIEVQLGEVTYAAAELDLGGRYVDWYMAVSGPEGPFPGGLPTLLIHAAPDGLEQCRADARAVLSTMRAAAGP